MKLMTTNSPQTFLDSKEGLKRILVSGAIGCCATAGFVGKIINKYCSAAYCCVKFYVVYIGSQSVRWVSVGQVGLSRSDGY